METRSIKGFTSGFGSLLLALIVISSITSPLWIQDCASTTYPVSSDKRNLSETNENTKTPYTTFRIREPSLGETFGDQRLFWYVDASISEYVQMLATLLSVGNYCYVYMANDSIELLGQNEAIAKCDALRLSFDLQIYPKAIEIAGYPEGRYGDIDGDLKVTLFLAPLVRLMGRAYLGYYLSENENPNFPYSNTREMVYVDSEQSINDTICTTIHEFNHLIWGNNEIDEAEFLTEGLANYAVDYTGYYSWVTDAVTTSFTLHPEISLLYFNRIYGALWDASYGQAYLFVVYLGERFGNDFLRNLVFTLEDGAPAIDAVLAEAGYDITFNELYLDWITACVIDNPLILDGKYGFESVDYLINKLTCFYQLPEEWSDITHYYYGFDVKKILHPPDSFTILIENPFPYSLGMSIVIKDINGWNVTQKLYSENSDLIEEYISGTDIQEIYIITSLMSATTPTFYGVVGGLDDLPSVKLDFKFIEGDYNPLEQTSEVSYDFLTFIIIFASTSIYLVLKRRRKNRIKVK
ncbi:MAG: hypothetical protein ACFFCZ_26170 [Promethearchaeota archaeon]